MGNFDKRGGGGFGNKRFGDRDGGRPAMFHAICSDCGRDCEVPFKPAHGKPVYCSDCFKKDGDGGSSRFDRPERSESRSFGKFDRRDSGRSNFSDRPMYEATCAECGNRCEVPFRPTGEKPVYCSNCFGGKGGDSHGPKKPDQSKEMFEQMNRKLDKIIKVLEILAPKREFVIEKKEKEEKTVEPKKTEKAVEPKKAPKAIKAKKEKKAKSKK